MENAPSANEKPARIELEAFALAQASVSSAETAHVRSLTLRGMIRALRSLMG